MKQSLTTYQIFPNCPKFNIFTKIVILKYILDQVLLPYKFYGRDM